jgi:hypothetical protein
MAPTPLGGALLPVTRTLAFGAAASAPQRPGEGRPQEAGQQAAARDALADSFRHTIKLRRIHWLYLPSDGPEGVTARRYA